MSQKQFNLSDLIKAAQEVFDRYGNVPVTIPDWMSEGDLLHRVNSAKAAKVTRHQNKAYWERSFRVNVPSKKAADRLVVFNVESYE